MEWGKMFARMAHAPHLQVRSLYPDLVFIAPFAGTIDIVACKRMRGTRGQHSILWHEQVVCGDRGEISDHLKSIFFRHPIRVATPAVLLASPEIGGFLLQPSVGNGSSSRSWVQHQLGLALPFGLSEIEFRTRFAKELAETFWVPLSWIKSQANALEKLGLKLEEIYPRAALFRQEASQNGAAPLLVEEGVEDKGGALHIFIHDLIRRSAPLPATKEAIVAQVSMERMALLGPTEQGNSALLPIQRSSATNIGERLLALWLDGSDAIHVNRARHIVFAPLIRISVAVALLATVVAVGLQWRIDPFQKSLQSAKKELRALSPSVQQARELEQSTATEKKYLAAIKQLDESSFPLEGLTAITNALPEQLWLQRVGFKNQAIELTGRGANDTEAARILGEKGIQAVAVRQEASATDTTGFQLRIELAPPTPGTSKAKEAQ